MCTDFTITINCYFSCSLAPAIEIFINHVAYIRMHTYVLSTVAIDVLGKFAQGVINWNRFSFQCAGAKFLLRESDYLFSTRLGKELIADN